MGKQQNISLPEEVASAGYKLKKGSPAKFYDPSFGDVDVRELTLDKAEELISNKCPYLEYSTKAAEPA